MKISERGQMIDFLCWTSFESRGLLTHCAPIDSHYAGYGDVFGPEIRPPFDEDRQSKEWASAVADNFREWAQENPY